jgi:ubiquinone/menaquinone biosynthesis C-methylase UbiE
MVAFQETVMKNTHVFPWWAGYLLLLPLRERSVRPGDLLGDHVSEGMTVLDAGCAMGFFSIPLAKLVGKHGRVICIDLQKRMLQTLERRARRRGLAGRIDTRQCSAGSLMADDLKGMVDFALAFAVVHESPCRVVFISELYRCLKQNGALIIGEPKGQVSEKTFNETVDDAVEIGFTFEKKTELSSYRYAVLRKA